MVDRFRESIDSILDEYDDVPGTDPVRLLAQMTQSDGLTADILADEWVRQANLPIVRAGLDWFSGAIQRTVESGRPEDNETGDRGSDPQEGEPCVDGAGDQELNATQIAMRLFEYVCELKKLDPQKRGTSWRAFEFLVELAELPDPIERPRWLVEENFDTFSSYLTKARRATESQIYGKGHGVETRSVRHHTKLDR